MVRAEYRELDGYCERHHVIPKALGGSGGTVVRLTYREHFLAHWLLTKFTIGEDRRKMLCALHRMTNRRRDKQGIIAGWQYDHARRAAHDAHVGQPKSPEHRRNTAEAIRRRRLMMRKKRKCGFRGLTHNATTLEQISQYNRGRTHSEKTKEKMRESQRRRRQTPVSQQFIENCQRAQRKNRKKMSAIITDWWSKKKATS